MDYEQCTKSGEGATHYLTVASMVEEFYELVGNDSCTKIWYSYSKIEN